MREGCGPAPRVEVGGALGSCLEVRRGRCFRAFGLLFSGSAFGRLPPDLEGGLPTLSALALCEVCGGGAGLQPRGPAASGSAGADPVLPMPGASSVG